MQSSTTWWSKVAPRQLDKSKQAHRRAFRLAGAQGVHELARPSQRWDDENERCPILKLHLGDGSC